MYDDKVNQSGVMIALLPMSAEWSKLRKPHLTLVYAGHVGQHDPTSYNELGKEAMDLGITFGPQTLEVLGIETFGDGKGNNPYCDVVLFKPTDTLNAMRKAVEHWNASEFPWRPHVTVGEVGAADGIDLPSKVTFDRVYTAMGSVGTITRLNP